jgi:acetolactate synthase I/II/III large subunit
MPSDCTVGDLVAEFPALCGVRNAFGIASVHNIPMLDAIGRRNAIRFVMARGELGGAHMAAVREFPAYYPFNQRPA